MIPAFTLLLAAMSPWPDAPRGDLLFRNTVVGVHARVRAQAGLPPLVWNAVLAAHAEAYAERLAAGAPFRHDPTPGRRKVEGENLWKGQRGLFTYEVILGTMTGEARWFRPGRYPDVSRNGDWSGIGHYTQMIWPTTTAVGCAMVSNAADDVLVCRYSPPGNKDGVWLR